MSKLKPLRPTLRERRRYIVFDIISEKKFSFDEIKDSILNSCLRFFGEMGRAKANLYLIKNQFDYDKQKGILRCSHKSLDNVIASLGLIKEIKGERAILSTTGVSGILKKARNKFLLKENKDK